MYFVVKTLFVSASHRLQGDVYSEACKNDHGHNFKICVGFYGSTLDDDGMVIDFGLVSHEIKSRLDHQNINHAFPSMNPTAENLCERLHDLLDKVAKKCNYNSADTGCTFVAIQETPNNWACYIEDRWKSCLSIPLT